MDAGRNISLFIKVDEHLLNRMWVRLMPERRTDEQLVTELVAYIQKHYDQRIWSLSEICQELMITSATAQRLVKLIEASQKAPHLELFKMGANYGVQRLV